MIVREDGYYALKNIVEGLEYSAAGLMKWIKEKRLAATKVGGKWIINGKDLKTFLDGAD